MSTPIPIFDPEDPKLTAYALGELTDPAERAEVELLLQHSPQAQLTMKEIQDLTKDLAAEYDQERREATEPTAPVAPNIIDLASYAPPRRGASWLAIAAVLLAVGLLVGLALPILTNRTRDSKKNAAQRKTYEAAVAKAEVPAQLAQAPVAQFEKHGPGVQLELENGRKLDDAKDSVALAVNPPAVPLAKSAPVDAVTVGGSTVAQPGTPALALAQPAKGEFQRYPGNPATGSLSDTFHGEGTAGTGTRATSENFAFQGNLPSGGIALPPNAVQGAVAQAAPASRVFKKDTDFYRKESGTKSGRAIGDLARNTAYPETRARVLSQVTSEEETLAPGQSEAPPEAAKPELRAKDKVIRREPPAAPEFNTAAYDHLVENPFLGAKENPLSTFSIDVDTASYANVRRFIDGGSLPPPDAVRLEELINYFPYDYAPPAADSGKPFAVHLEAAACPWAPEHRLVRVGIKGKEIALDKRPASNLVFLLDVSGSMQPPERLPLVKQAMRMLTEQLTENDHVAIVTYAGNSGLVLPSTSGDHKERILAALDNLNAGGSTNGASGIALAYRTAKEAFIKGGTNRVILATDGDFNVGVTSQGELVRMIQEEAKSGVFLSALGVGTDNFKDSTMQKLADKGNGNYNYIDRLEEARKVLVEQMSGTLLTIAKDVKIQVEFNPALVGSYRLIGYEKRTLRKEDFNNDQIDAGEIGAGHSITALYEVVPVGQPVPGAAPAVDTLKYAAPAADAAAQPRPASPPAVNETGVVASSPEMLTVKLRHKAPDADKSERTYEVPLVDKGAADDFSKASSEFKFAAAVATFGLTLRDSPYKGNATFGAAAELAQEGKGSDPKGYRAEFINLLRRAQALKDGRQTDDR